MRRRCGRYRAREEATSLCEPTRPLPHGRGTETCPHANGHGTAHYQAILKDGWKLVHYINQNETELYYLDKNEGERNNLAKAEPKRARQLLATLQAWVKETRRN